MSADRDIALDEKRVYGARDGATTAFVATGAGLARVSVSGDMIGEFALARRGDVRDVVGSEGRLAVAAEDALVGTGESFVETGFGPASAVGFDDGLVAAGEGRVARHDGDWTTCATIANVRAIAGGLCAAAGGVFRVEGDHVGLADARDLSTAGEVLAATGEGIFTLANGWQRVLDGGFRAVVADGDRAFAVADDGRLVSRAGDDWVDVGMPGEVADVAIGEAAVYAVTTDGTFLVDAGAGWRDRMLGLPDARRLAVP